MQKSTQSIMLKRIVNTIVESVHPERIILFGSRARGNYKNDSDFDFMVVKQGVKNEREISRRIYRALFEKKIAAPVDVIVVDTNKLKKNKEKSHLVYFWALKEGKILYG